MCPNHHHAFDAYQFFIRFLPDVSLICLCFWAKIHKKQVRKFVFINHSDEPAFRQFHGKAIVITSIIAMRRSLPSSLSKKCASGDITPSHLLSATCPIPSFSKTGC